MAEEAMVKESLTKEMIQAGADLTRRLDDARLRVNASFWLYISDSNLWRLIIASPAVREAGPKKVYKKIQSVLPKTDKNELSILLKDISVIEDNNYLSHYYKLL
jgi:hypothetical protein